MEEGCGGGDDDDGDDDGSDVNNDVGDDSNNDNDNDDDGDGDDDDNVFHSTVIHSHQCFQMDSCNIYHCKNILFWFLIIFNLRQKSLGHLATNRLFPFI